MMRRKPNPLDTLRGERKRARRCELATSGPGWFDVRFVVRAHRARARASDDTRVRRRDSDARGRGRIRRARGIAGCSPALLRRDGSGTSGCPIRISTLTASAGHAGMQVRAVQLGHGSKPSASPGESSSSSSRSAARNAIHGPYTGCTVTPRMLGPAMPATLPSSMKLSVGPLLMNG